MLIIMSKHSFQSSLVQFLHTKRSHFISDRLLCLIYFIGITNNFFKFSHIAIASIFVDTNMHIFVLIFLSLSGPLRLIGEFMIQHYLIQLMQSKIFDGFFKFYPCCPIGTRSIIY